MAFEVGQIVDGKVSGITGFGAFVDLEGGQTGLVHISEVARNYVKDINEHLTVGQEVKVKVLSLDEKGKICLERAGLMAYSHGEYYSLGRPLGRFGFSTDKMRPVSQEKTAKPAESKSKKTSSGAKAEKDASKKLFSESRTKKGSAKKRTSKKKDGKRV